MSAPKRNPEQDLAPCVCPGCGGQNLSDGEYREGLPVFQNFLCSSRDEARALRRGAEQLSECGDCGLVFNRMFDPALLNYDDLYDAQQEFSDVFRQHMMSVASYLSDAYLRDGGRTLEVGCGRGGFLRLLRDNGCRRCVGYDAACPAGPEDDEGIEFHQRYLTAADIQEPFDLVVCRHVAGQVGEIGSFLQELAGIAEAAGDAVVAIETADFDWIAEQGSFWDVYYERCNYFTQTSLACLCERAGFKVLRQRRLFGGQYQLIELKPDRAGSGRPPVTGFLERYEEQKRRSQTRLARAIEARRPGSQWAIWGAAGKGTALANQFGAEGLFALIDKNPAKQGGYAPGCAVRIISADDPRIADLGLILIANPNYEQEIMEALSALRFSGEVVVA